MTRSLVDHPDEVNVDVVDLDDRLELNVSVADGDMGRVIGKRGRMANAIRVVTRAAAVRDGVEVDIEFVD
ncbi:MAG: KH domain-containing protein [Microthrixaceae bacterium]|nr:KH domain-containing protein [Microthrixaceae bacterium]